MSIQIESQKTDGNVLIMVKGEVDLASSPDLRKAILQSVPPEDGVLGIHLGDVSYMDSSGVATMVEGLKMAMDKKVRFALVAPSNAVMKVLQLARLDAVFDIRESLDS